NIFPAHPRKDSKIRQLAHYGSGVWISIRLDSTIRLFHTETYQHLQDLDVESFITKMLGPNKLDLVLLRITSLSILDKRIWIGIGSGIIVSIPFGCEDNSNNNKSTNEKAKGPEGFSDLTYNSEQTKAYMVSGGDGYIDFRLGDDTSCEENTKSSSSQNNNSNVRVCLIYLCGKMIVH
uniref:Uncharacterized protein n=1 Tax=Meloidogyne javanica TaxID=6303 RepID=A0A915LVR6_MELJA